MSKYEPLARYLKALKSDSWDANLPEIERVLGFALPKSAYAYPAWWSNQEGPHSQTRGWRDAGWETCNVDLPAKRLRFVRKGKRTSPVRHERSGSADVAHAARDIDALIASARELTGIEDRDDLIAAALTHLVQTEAAKSLAALGGCDPQAQAAERRRSW